MVNFHTIAHAMSIVKSVYATRDWYITGPKKDRTGKLEQGMRPIWNTFINDVMTGMDYGYAPFFKEFDYRNGMLLYKNLTPIKPHNTTILVDGKSQFAGIDMQIYGTPQLTNIPQPENARNKQYVYIPVEKCFIYSYDSKFNDLYGKPRLRAARYPYVVYKFIIEMCNIFYSNFADPTKIGYAPQGRGRSEAGAVEKTNVDLLRDKLKLLGVGGDKDMVLPSTTDEKGNKLWDIKLLESQRTGADYIAYLEYLEKKMSHGVLVPELAFQQGKSGGSYNLWEGQAMFLAYKSDLDMAVAGEQFDKYLLNPLILYNWGEGEIDQYHFNFTKSSKEDRQIVGQTIQAAMQNTAVEPDWEQISRVSGIKFTKTNNVVDIAKQISAKTAEDAKAKFEKRKSKYFTQMELPLNSERALTPIEQSVDFEKLKKIYNNNAAIAGKLNGIIADMKEGALKEAQKQIKKINPEKPFSLMYKSTYIDVYGTEMTAIFDSAREMVIKELEINNPVKPGIRELELSRAKQTATQQISYLEATIKDTLLAGIANNVSGDVIGQQISDFFKDYESKIVSGVDISIQQFVDDGRRNAADDPDVELATWSAFLEGNVCPACEELNGMTTEVGSDEYNKYTPGNMHYNCACVWIYTLKDSPNKPPVDFVEPSQEMQDKYMRR